MSDTANLDVMQHAKHYNQAMAKLVMDSLFLNSRNGEVKRSVLDFGAGQGTFLHLLQSATKGRPLQWYAVEPDLSQIKASKETQVFTDLSVIPDGVLDCVYSLNVFEHIKDDKAAFKQLLAKVKVGGFLFVLVPAYMELWTTMDTQVGHHRRYTPQSLRFLVRDHDVVVVDEGGFDMFGYWAAKWCAFREKRKNIQDAAPLSAKQIKMYDFLFRFLNPVFSFFHHLGSSLKAKNRWILIKKLG